MPRSLVILCPRRIDSSVSGANLSSESAAGVAPPGHQSQTVEVVLEQLYRGSFERLLQYSGFLVVVMLLVMLLHVVFNVAKEWVRHVIVNSDTEFHITIIFLLPTTPSII